MNERPTRKHELTASQKENSLLREGIAQLELELIAARQTIELFKVKDYAEESISRNKGTGITIL